MVGFHQFCLATSEGCMNIFEKADMVMGCNFGMPAIYCNTVSNSDELQFFRKCISYNSYNNGNLKYCIKNITNVLYNLSRIL